MGIHLYVYVCLNTHTLMPVSGNVPRGYHRDGHMGPCSAGVTHQSTCPLKTTLQYSKNEKDIGDQGVDFSLWL